MKELGQVVAVLILGGWIGFVCGMGSAFGKIEKLAEYKPRITNGTVHIHGNGQPVTVSGFYIDMAGQDGAAISVDSK